VYTPVVGFTVIVAPPADTAGALYDNTRPAGSVTTVDPVNPPVALSSTVHDELPATGDATVALAAGATTSAPLTRARVSTSRNAPHTSRPNASSGLPAVFEPVSPSTDNTRDSKPGTGAVTDAAGAAGRLRIGAENSCQPPAGTHPADTDAATPATEPRDTRRSAHRGTAVAAVPETSPPGTPPPPTRASTLTPAATPGITGDAAAGEALFGVELAWSGLAGDEPPALAVLARSDTPTVTTCPRGLAAESPPDAPPSPGAAPRPPRRPTTDGRDTEPADDPEPDPPAADPPADTVVSEPVPPTGPEGSAQPTAGATPTPTPTPNATASAPTRPTSWAALLEPEPACTASNDRSGDGADASTMFLRPPIVANVRRRVANSHQTIAASHQIRYP